MQLSTEQTNGQIFSPPVSGDRGPQRHVLRALHPLLQEPDVWRSEIGKCRLGKTLIDIPPSLRQSPGQDWHANRPSSTSGHCVRASDTGGGGGEHENWSLARSLSITRTSHWPSDRGRYSGGIYLLSPSAHVYIVIFFCTQIAVSRYKTSSVAFSQPPNRDYSVCRVMGGL